MSSKSWLQLIFSWKFFFFPSRSKKLESFPRGYSIDCWKPWNRWLHAFWCTWCDDWSSQMFLWIRWFWRRCVNRRRSEKSTANYTNCTSNIPVYYLRFLFLRLDCSDDDVALLRPGIYYSLSSIIVNENSISNFYNRTQKLRFLMSLNKLAGLPSCGSLISEQFLLFVPIFLDLCFHFPVFFMRWPVMVSFSSFSRKFIPRPRHRLLELLSRDCWLVIKEKNYL